MCASRSASTAPLLAARIAALHDHLAQERAQAHASADLPEELTIPAAPWLTPVPPVVPLQATPLPEAPRSWRARLRAVPLLGYALAWCNALLRLPRTRAHLARDLTRLHGVLDQQAARLAELEALMAQLGRYAEQQARALAHQQHRRLQAYDHLQIGARLSALEAAAAKVAQVQRSAPLPEVSVPRPVASAPSVGAPQATQAHPATPGTLDALYLAFEQRFRGSEQEIRRRLAHAYLDRLQPLIEHCRTVRPQQPVALDVGCGRGEWLALLSEQGIPAQGVDLNAAMVQACQARGLRAECIDALTYLRAQPAGNVQLVSAFHLIEHLPFAQMVALIDAAYAALAPGGFLILETPNPENLIVGACNFYYDPTHLHPLVPDVMHFVALQRGFARAEIVRLHPFPDDYQLSSATPEAATLNRFLFSAQDYALIATR